MSFTGVRPQRRGISLLEVLISIGIISIGLLATFSLIPAGRSYMQKAAIDDRAAALVPAAFETIATRGLLKTTALTWEVVPDGTYPDPEWSSPSISSPLNIVIREQSNKDVTDPDPSKYPGNTGQTRDELWTIDTIDTETIVSHYDRTTPFTTLTGTVNPGSPPSSRPVSISSTPNTGPNGVETSHPTTGRWTLNIPSGNLPLPGGSAASGYKMEIFTSGPSVGQVKSSPPPYTDYTFTATYTDNMGTPQTSAVTPASPYRQYAARRKLDRRTGYAFLEYTRPANATETNQTPAAAATIPIKTLDNASGTGRNSVARSVTKRVSGTLWRMTIGTVRGPYTQDVDFADANNAPPQPRTPDCNTVDIAVNAGTFVSGSSDIDDEIDWYRFGVRAAEIIKIDGSVSSITDFVKDPETNTRYFPAYLDDTSRPLIPLAGFSEDYYFIPRDGSLLVRAELSPGARNTIYGANNPRYNSNGPLRSNPNYTIDIGRLPSERVVVVDPLAATRLDRTLINSGTTAENLLRRQRFADYVQVYGPGTPPNPLTGTAQQRVIPRLNWSALANTPTPASVDAAIAAAELLFRENDSLLVDTSGTFATADSAPGPLFDVDATNNPVRRQTAGRMSWLMMLQPEDAGPVAVNWTAGKWFDVSVVVFEDRPLPSLAGGPFTGEYAQANVTGQSPLPGVWSDLDGTLTVTIPPGTDLTEDTEVRQLFRTGAWILLAPKVIDPNESPLSNTTRLDWVRVQSARLGASGGVRTVSLLLESEPSASTLNRGLQTTAPNYEVVVLAYSGVVAVVNRSVQLE